MDKLQYKLDGWAIQELSCSPLYDGELGARDTVIGWSCHIINRGWYQSRYCATLEEAIEDAILQMAKGNESDDWGYDESDN